ncbi:MAG TPA: FKBP-type peptidyl-prolyl cis-trans isomerase [Candidatus Paceibacterota bacterium]|nr:FKBP-type peptidyl-prolyl cis-trans isomerase [Candidatus Paceibacterota bacterium]
MTTNTTVTPTGIAIAIAVVVALGFLFFGSGVFSFFSGAGTDTPFTTSETETALMITDTTVGTGVEAAAGSRVTVNYVGMFENGQVFDTSANRGPFSFVLGAGEVIPGWDQGLIGMKEGGVRRLVIPSDLAYGDAGYGPIPGGATLIFDVELVDVEEVQ